MKDNNEEWTLVIEPTNKILDLKINEVWQYRDLLVLFVKRDFIAAYKQTILGPLWHFIQPFFTTIIFLIVFNKIADIPTDNIKPILFYMSGITVWNYFSSCLTATSNTFSANASIFGKVYFPRLVLPLSIVLSNMIKFGIQFLLLLVGIFYYYFQGEGIYFGLSWLMLPLLLLMMACMGLGLGIIISALTTKYRDFNVLIGFAVQLLMYATPIVYPLSYLQDKNYAVFIKYNPLSPIVEAFRYSIFHHGTLSFNSLLYSSSFIIVIFIIGLITFNRVERTFMDTV